MAIVSESKNILSFTPPDASGTHTGETNACKNHESIKQILLDSKLDRLDTRLLLGHVLGFSKTELITKDNYQLSPAQYQSFITVYNKCQLGMPVAYILGYKEFYSRRFKVTPETLIPRPDTELLVDTLLGLAKPKDNVLDLGTGSGCIAISCKLENQDLNITASDKYPETLKIAMENAIALGAKIKFIRSDWFENIKGKYDIIVSNPPYIAPDDEHLKDLAFEPQDALTDFCDGMSAIKEIIASSLPFLNGYLLLEHGYNQGPLTAELMVSHGFKNVRTIKDYATLDRITLGHI